MTEFPHVAPVGGQVLPPCNCGVGIENQNSEAHKAVCPFGQWLEEGNRIEGLPTEPQVSYQSGPVIHHCDCIAMMVQEAEGFTREATQHPAGSRLNLLFLAQAEYLKQLAERVRIRQRFIGTIADVGKPE